MPIVIDASFAGAILLPDEAPPSEPALRRLKDEQLVVPPHWWLEIANLVQMAVHRGRLDAADRTTALGRADALAVTSDVASVTRAWTTTLALADSHRLTVYDAAYLELALRRGAALATLDGRLLVAARASGIATVS